MRPSRGLNWTDVWWVSAWTRLNLSCTTRQRCRSPALSATLNSLFDVSCSPVACNDSAAFSLSLSLSQSLLMSFSLLCSWSHSLARGALRVVRLQWLHLHRFAPVSRFLGNIIFLYLFFRHRCWQWALCQCRYCCSSSSSVSSYSSLSSLKVAFSLINRHFLHGYCHACALTPINGGNSVCEYVCVLECVKFLLNFCHKIL